jgi:hypothetical protein
MNILVEGLNFNQYTFCACADDLQGISKAFHYPIQLLTLKFLLEKISFLCYWSMLSSAVLSLAAEKMLQNKLVTGGFQHDFKESQPASCLHFQYQNHHFKVFEAGYWKHFQN